jgi:hypothetical protein
MHVLGYTNLCPPVIDPRIVTRHANRATARNIRCSDAGTAERDYSLHLLKDLSYVVLLAGFLVAAGHIVAEWSGTRHIRRTGALLIACAAALCVWMMLLGMTLPSEVTARHWATAWVGLDAMEACCLAATGVLTLRGDSRVGAVAGAAAALLTADAWFDVTTAQKGSDYLFAVILGVGIELPLAAVCALIAWNAPRRFMPNDAGSDRVNRRPIDVPNRRRSLTR